jgi:hypothetical protein
MPALPTKQDFLAAARLEEHANGRVLEITRVLARLRPAPPEVDPARLLEHVDALMDALYRRQQLTCPGHRWLPEPPAFIAGHLVTLYANGNIAWSSETGWTWREVTSLFCIATPPAHGPWKTIDGQTDLDELDAAVCWEDSRAREYWASAATQPYFPADVSRSGYDHKNLHVLLETCSSVAPFLELVFVHCDRIAQDAFDRLELRGRVDSLRRIELRTDDGSPLLRCARIVYRWLTDASTQGDFYGRGESGNPEDCA